MEDDRAISQSFSAKVGAKPDPDFRYRNARDDLRDLFENKLVPEGVAERCERAYEMLTLAINELADMRAKIENAECMRPHWAMGFSSDSVAAQAKTVALDQLWQLLHVRDQTSAVQRLREVLDRDNRARLGLPPSVDANGSNCDV